MTPTSNLSPGDSAERAIAGAPKVAKPAVTAVVCLTNCLRWMEGFMSRKTLQRGPVFNFEAPSFALAWFGASGSGKFALASQAVSTQESIMYFQATAIAVLFYALTLM